MVPFSFWYTEWLLVPKTQDKVLNRLPLKHFFIRNSFTSIWWKVTSAVDKAMDAQTQGHTVRRSSWSPWSCWRSNSWQRSAQSSYAGTRHGHRQQGHTRCSWLFPMTRFRPDTIHRCSRRPEGRQSHPAHITHTKHMGSLKTWHCSNYTVHELLGYVVILSIKTLNCLTEFILFHIEVFLWMPMLSLKQVTWTQWFQGGKFSSYSGCLVQLTWQEETPEAPAQIIES